MGRDTHVAKTQWVHICMSNDLLEDCFLVSRMRPGNGDRLTAMICIRASYNTKNWVIVGLCIFESFQNHRSYGVGSTISTRAIVKRIAITYECLLVQRLLIQRVKESTSTYQ
jgi:hypothetical protein